MQTIRAAVGADTEGGVVPERGEEGGGWDGGVEDYEAGGGGIGVSGGRVQEREGGSIPWS